MQFENTSRPLAGKPLAGQAQQTARPTQPALNTVRPTAGRQGVGSSGINRPASSNAAPAQARYVNKPVQPTPAKPLQSTMRPVGLRQPVPAQKRTPVSGGTAPATSNGSSKTGGRQTVTGWPSSAIAGISKTNTLLKRSAAALPKPGVSTATATVKKTVTGWPHLKHGIGQFSKGISSRHRMYRSLPRPNTPGIATQNLQPGITRRIAYRQAPTFTRPGTTGRSIYPSSRQVAAPNPGVNYTRPGSFGRRTLPQYYTRGYRRTTPIYGSYAIPNGTDTRATIWPGQQPAPGSGDHSCSCGNNTAPGAVNTPAATPTQQPNGACQHCGENSSGCATLARFSFNSVKLKAHHAAQLKALAAKILGGINAVVTIGYTDTSGPEKYNDDLGYRRALTVVNELRRMLHKLRPNSDRPVFWRIDSAGESMQLPGANAANNRRVEICLKQAAV